MIQNMYYAPTYQYFTQDKYYNYYNTGYPQILNTSTYQYYYNNMPAQQYIPSYQHNYYNDYSNMNFVDTYAQSYTNQPKTYDIYNEPNRSNNFEQYSSPVIGENILYYLDSRSSSRFNLESNNELRSRNNLQLKQRKESVLTTREEDLDGESFLSRTSSELNFTRLSNDEDRFELVSSSAENFAQFSSPISY
jgi:hypothetical protein